MQELWGGNTWEEASLLEKAGKIALTFIASPLLFFTSCSKVEPEKTELPPPPEDDSNKKEIDIEVDVTINTTVIIQPGMSVEDFMKALDEIFGKYNLDKIADYLKEQGLELSEIKALLDQMKTQQAENHKEIQETHAIMIAMMESMIKQMKDNNATLGEILTELRNSNVKLDDIIGVLVKQNFTLEAIFDELKKQGVKLDEHGDLLNLISTKLSTLQKDDKEALEKILIAITTNTEVAKGTQGLVEEILAKLDRIGKDSSAILEIVSKIASNEPVDLSTIQDMLAKILAATQRNGTVLDSIEDKLNFVGVALEGIKDQIGEGNEKVLAKLQEILDKIPDGCNCQALDLTVVINKLNEIIAKMEDSSNGNHEGILGDLGTLDDLL